MRHSNNPNMDLCGTPQQTIAADDLYPSIPTNSTLLDK